MIGLFVYFVGMAMAITAAVTVTHTLCAGLLTYLLQGPTESETNYVPGND